MFDYLLTKEQLKIRDEVRECVKWAPKQWILDMDPDKIKFPKEFLREAGRRSLMGCRYPREYHKAKAARLTRDHEGDAPEAEAQEEKIYE
jgi:hypothetical protein